MKSKLLAKFRIFGAEYQITRERDAGGVPRVIFRSEGNPTIGLDIAGASKLRQMLAEAGDINEAYEIDRHIVAARRLPLKGGHVPPAARQLGYISRLVERKGG